MPEVVAVTRAMRALELLAEASQGATVSDLSRRLRCGKGTVSKFLTTLEAGKYVCQDAETARFFLTWRLLALAWGHADRTGIPRLFVPVLQELADETDELVQLALVDGEQVHFVAKAEGRAQRIRMLSLVGTWVPLHATASGKVWLASLGADELTAVLGRQELSAVAPRTITSRRALRSELRRVREQGYAIADEELVEGGRAVAAPIRCQGRVVGAIALSGPTYRLPVTRLRALAPQLQAAAQRLAAIWPPHVTAKDFGRGQA